MSPAVFRSIDPVLFVFYINDLTDSVISDIILYADDTKMSKEIQSDTDTVVIQDDLFYFQEWSDDWLLLFHPPKMLSQILSCMRMIPKCPKKYSQTQILL